MSYQSDISGGRKASLLEFFITIVFSTMIFIYLSLAVYTKDLLWGWPFFKSQPAAGLVRCYGREVILEKNSADLTAISAMVNEQLTGKKRWDELNLTDQTYGEYQSNSQMTILEFFYDAPQRLHSISPFFSGFDSILIPLDGRHSETFIVFALIDGRPSGGSFHVQDLQPVVDYLVQRNLCIKP
jgi:hypothetical protein